MIKENLSTLYNELPPLIKIVAVSKFHPENCIIEAYEAGQRIFGESKALELCHKAENLKDLCPEIKWHFIGHLQTNKLKIVLPYADLIQSVDNIKLLNAINSWGERNNKAINILLELKIASEESKQGLCKEEILAILRNADSFPFVHFCGLMGIATNSEDEFVIRKEFGEISELMDYINSHLSNLTEFCELSIGMSNDYKIAIENKATMVRIGTAIFGERNY